MNTEKEIKRLKLMVIGLLGLNSILLLSSFGKTLSTKERFEQIDVERINIVEKSGKTRMVIFNADQLPKGKDTRQGENTIAGMIFLNEEGYECGGIVFDGKKISGGQKGGGGLMFDGFRQDQTIALQHNEFKDSTRFTVDAGLTINYRPDFSVKKDEYEFYNFYRNFNGAQQEKDSLFKQFADQYKVATQRLFMGNIHGLKNGEIFDETGLFIKNRYGKNVIRIFVDSKNNPRLEFYDSLGKDIIYEFDHPGKGKHLDKKTKKKNNRH